MNNNQFGRPYMVNYPNNFNPQITYEQQIDNEINNLQQMKERIRNNTMQQPTLNQTIQVSPTPNIGIKYVNSIEDVNKESVFVDTPFFSKDLSVLWIKNASGDIKAYELNEIIQKDEKDLQIEFLTARLSQLEGMIRNEQSNSNANAEQVTTSSTTSDEPVGEPIKESKSTGVSRVSTSKKK